MQCSRGCRLDLLNKKYTVHSMHIHRSCTVSIGTDASTTFLMVTVDLPSLVCKNTPFLRRRDADCSTSSRCQSIAWPFRDLPAKRNWQCSQRRRVGG